MSAALLRRQVALWRSTQLYEALSRPPTNHLAQGACHSSTCSQRVNQSKRAAASAQKPSGSSWARWYTAGSRTTAAAANSPGGGKRGRVLRGAGRRNPAGTRPPPTPTREPPETPGAGGGKGARPRPRLDIAQHWSTGVTDQLDAASRPRSASGVVAFESAPRNTPLIRLAPPTSTRHAHASGSEDASPMPVIASPHASTARMTPHPCRWTRRVHPLVAEARSPPTAGAA